MRHLLVPIAVSAAATATISYFGCAPTFAQGSEVSQFGGTLASIGVTMLGFMLAALAIIASINHTSLVAAMRKSGHYEDLLATLFAGCLMFLACSALGYALLFGLEASSKLLSAVVGIHIGALASLVDVGRKFRLVLSNLRT